MTNSLWQMVNCKKAILIFALFLLLSTISYLPSAVSAQQTCPDPRNDCGSQRSNDFIRACTKSGRESCSAEYVFSIWCDANHCLSFAPPPENKISKADFKGYGSKEQSTTYAPPDCLPVGMTNTFGEAGVCKPVTGGVGGTFTGSDKGGFGSMLGTVKAPPQLANLLGNSGDPDIELTKILSRAVELLYMGASLIFVLYFLWSSIEFIYSQGNKEQVAEARSRITYAIIGIFILAVTFVMLKILSQITGFKFFG